MSGAGSVVKRVTEGRWWYVLMLCPLPIAVIIAGAQDMLYETHCGPLHTLGVLISSKTHGKQCHRLTLSADVPSIGLALAVLAEAWLFAAGEKSWRGLREALENSGVLARGNGFRFDPHGLRERTLWRITDTRRGRAVTWLVAVGLSVAFYAIAYSSAHLFHDYASGSHQRYKHVRAIWWANYHHQPLLALTWILVGTAGLYLAALDLTRFASRTLTLRRLAPLPIWHFVPSRSQVGHPWDPILRLTNLRIWGFVLFLATIFDVIYLARSPQTSGAANIALLIVTLLVVFFTLVPGRRYFRAVQEAYADALARECSARAGVAAAVPAQDYAAQAYVVLHRLELSYENVPPSLSALKRIGSVVALTATVGGVAISLVQLVVG